MYRAVSVVALPLASLYLMWRSRRQPAYRQFWDERFWIQWNAEHAAAP